MTMRHHLERMPDRVLVACAALRPLPSGSFCDWTGYRQDGPRADAPCPHCAGPVLVMGRRHA